MFSKFKLIAILVAIIILMAAAISVQQYYIGFVKDERNRFEQNYNASESKIEQYKTKSGADAITIKEKQLTIQELKQTHDSTIHAMHLAAIDMGNKNRELQQLLSISMETRIDSVFIPVLDTVIIRPAEDTITRLATITSKWLDASIAVHTDELEIINYISRDEIDIALSWYKERKVFFMRWFERKKYHADIRSLNPNSRIKAAENIRITGRRGH